MSLLVGLPEMFDGRVKTFSSAGIIITMALHAHIHLGDEQYARWWPRF
jgi:hypothetical protein